MKQRIHPVSVATQYECANCGTEIPVKSTQPAQAKLDTCSNCHPAYTGKVLSSVSGSRVDHFNDRYSLST
jgi:large subunit ribosomal protein L31